MAVIEINDSNFDNEIVHSKEVVLVDFWVPLSGSCLAMEPVVDSLEKMLGKRYKFCKINIDENKELAQRYNIMSVPTLMVFKNGRVCNIMTGINGRNEIAGMLGSC